MALKNIRKNLQFSVSSLQPRKTRAFRVLRNPRNPTVDMEIGMAITAVIFDAFGTILRIISPRTRIDSCCEREQSMVVALRLAMSAN